MMCPTCKNAIPDWSSFCTVCGARQPELWPIPVRAGVAQHRNRFAWRTLVFGVVIGVGVILLPITIFFGRANWAPLLVSGALDLAYAPTSEPSSATPDQTTVASSATRSQTSGGVSLGATAQDARPRPTLIVAATESPPAPTVAVRNYLQGMTQFDAQRMWDALDQQAVTSMTSQGGSEAQLQQRLDQARQSGAQYDDVAYVGEHQLLNGDTYLFYVVTREGFTGKGVRDQVFFVFTVGPNGKILKIE